MLKPGRDLDALIAEKVMTGVNKFEGLFVKSVDNESGTVTFGTEFRYPPYSTSIEAAWEVVEKMISYSENRFVIEKSGAWLVKFGSDGFTPGKTAPHAICLAALHAIGVDV